MPQRPRIRTAIQTAAAAVALELGASWLLLTSDRAQHLQNFEQVDSSYSSLVNLARRAGRLAAGRLGRSGGRARGDLAIAVLPCRSAAGLQRVGPLVVEVAAQRGDEIAADR